MRKSSKELKEGSIVLIKCQGVKCPIHPEAWFVKKITGDRVEITRTRMKSVKGRPGIYLTELVVDNAVKHRDELIVR